MVAPHPPHPVQPHPAMQGLPRPLRPPPLVTRQYRERSLESPFKPNGDPTQHRSWPAKWQEYLELTRTFALNDLLFSHGFPSPFVLRNSAGEALTLAWNYFHRLNKDLQLSEITLDDYHDPLRTLLIKDVRNHRSKLRDAILGILRKDPRFGNESSPDTISERAEHFIRNRRFLNSPYVTNRTPLVMYNSQILSQALAHVYTSKQWRAAMALTVEKSEGFDYPHAHTTLEDLWIVCPPPPLVAFVGTLIFNALSCCTVGFDVSRAPLDEESHRPYYSELLLFIEKEWNDKELGGHVQTRLERAINYVRFAQPAPQV